RPHRLAVEWAAGKHQIVAGGSPMPILASFELSARIEKVPARGDESPPAKADIPRIEKNDKPKPPPENEKATPGLKREPPPIKEKPALRGARRTQEVRFALPPPKTEEDVTETGFEGLLAELPVAALPYKPLLTAKSFALAIDLGAESKARWHIDFADDEAA